MRSWPKARHGRDAILKKRPRPIASTPAELILGPQVGVRAPPGHAPAALQSAGRRFRIDRFGVIGRRPVVIENWL